MTREELKTQLAASSAGKNVSKVAAVLIGLGSLAIASAIQPMTPISFFGVLFVGAIPTILLWLKGDDHNAIIVKAWSDYYANSKWKTPAGEEVVVVGTNHNGTVVRVRFPDGYKTDYSLWLLKPSVSFERLARPENVSESDSLLETVAVTRWRHLDGSIGIVRGARRSTIVGEAAYTDYITLKMRDGTFEFMRDDLVPTR